MAETQPQTLANHTRFDPAYHFFLAPVFLLAVIVSVIYFFARIAHGGFRQHFHSALIVLFSVALLVLLAKMRLYALKVQDRLIRLEERGRLMQLLPEPLRSRVPELTVDQLCGLRFASDPELSTLVQRTLDNHWTRKQIKQAIEHWRPDYWRV